MAANSGRGGESEIDSAGTGSSSDAYRANSDVDGWPFRKPKDSGDFVAEERISTGTEANAELYNMNHERRGVALIFNHIHFKSMPARNGTVKDCADLKGALSNLGFEVRVYTDPTTKTISTILQLAAAEDHTDADCLIVAVMSHGESGMLYSNDTVYPVEMLWTPFTANRCATLVGKPKLFFIQACRGAQLDKGVRVVHETDSRAATFSIPTFADIMVAYSTYEGFYSWRNPEAGSWFVQSICSELNLNGRTRDLLTMMTFVNRRVAIEYQSFVPHNETLHAKKQIPSVVSMLTRLVYFPEKTTSIAHDAARSFPGRNENAEECKEPAKIRHAARNRLELA